MLYETWNTLPALQGKQRGRRARQAEPPAVPPGPRASVPGPSEAPGCAGRTPRSGRPPSSTRCVLSADFHNPFLSFPTRVFYSCMKEQTEVVENYWNYYWIFEFLKNHWNKRVVQQSDPSSSLAVWCWNASSSHTAMGKHALSLPKTLCVKKVAMSFPHHRSFVLTHKLVRLRSYSLSRHKKNKKSEINLLKYSSEVEFCGVIWWNCSIFFNNFTHSS